MNAWNKCRELHKDNYNVCDLCAERFLCWTTGNDKYLELVEFENIIHVIDNYLKTINIANKQISNLLSNLLNKQA